MGIIIKIDISFPMFNSALITASMVGFVAAQQTLEDNKFGVSTTLSFSKGKNEAEENKDYHERPGVYPRYGVYGHTVDGKHSYYGHPYDHPYGHPYWADNEAEDNKAYWERPSAHYGYYSPYGH